jgi:RNA polymerase sigma-70 factor (ECF subfamily)
MKQEDECARDAALVQRVCAGEKVLFYELLAPYRRLLFAAAYAVLRNPEDAEEAVQEGTLKAFLHLADLKEPSRFRPWLLRIIANEARMNRRHARRDISKPLENNGERDGDFYPRQFADWHDLPDEALEREELRKAVRDAV